MEDFGTLSFFKHTQKTTKNTTKATRKNNLPQIHTLKNSPPHIKE